MSAPLPENKAFDDQFAGVYDQLRRIAAAMVGNSSNKTLNPTAVVHEAYAKLVHGAKLPAVTELSFKRIAAHAMRQILCDAARRRHAEKRGGKGAVRISVDDQLAERNLPIEQILTVNSLLERLQAASPRRASVLELVYFGGLTVPEAAGALEISDSTAERDWRFARAWLAAELNRPAARALGETKKANAAE